MTFDFDMIQKTYQAFPERINRARERLTTLKAGNQVVLEEASVDEFLATLMANRKVGGQSDRDRNASF